MLNGIKTIDPHRLNKRFGLKFYVGSWVWLETLEEDQTIHWPKHCEYNKPEVR